ncbi:hypothetical protein V494_06423 [Pseudogymnoascus sp. VKM F-4513 (FW-928)]|nr:hypothetical protein V494_06423 [Pseudogymnoascus sp. VKM F-4513 (FW-928)]
MKRLITKVKRLVRILEGQANPSTSDAAPTATASNSDITSTEIDPQSTPFSKAKQSNHNSRLENLPPEIRRHILSILDLPRLKLLVRASPVFHEQYLFDRKYFLCKSIEETLGSATVDAYAVHQSVVQAVDVEQRTAWDLQSYLEQSKRRYLPHADNNTQEEARSVAASYLHTVKPIAEQYARWSLDNLATFVAKEPQSRHEKVTHILTDMEALRFTRAIYRFQVLCQITDYIYFGREFPYTPGYTTLRDETLFAFIGVMEPWETEEMLSFYQFAWESYDNIFSKIRWDLHADNPKFDDQRRPPTPDGAFDLDNSMCRGDYLEGTTLRGLSLLHTVIFKIKDHEHLVSTMQQPIVSSYIPFRTMEGVMSETHQHSQRSNHPSGRDQMQQERTPFPFRGDADEPNAPPLAWTIIWHDTYSNLFGCHIPDEMRRWGYVFWDAATLENNGGKGVLHKQWEEPWDACDPRDDLIY